MRISSVTPRRRGWDVLLAFAVLAAFLFLHLHPHSPLESGQAHGAASAAEFVALDCDAPHDDHARHEMPDTVSRVTRVGDLSAPAIAPAALPPNAISVQTAHGTSRPRPSARSRRDLGRLHLIELCVSRV
ncbi:hypothetical protein [Amycolatopsis sp. H20-H5]|uniref:hypothetical protein n=1 Tax=Amycolatopsis sp. H20-H5 TaxID=3046309 RepID=UPI002DB6B505|nr:hypothetical protein [Amycolatopsis sp. H20-H5]MEC3974405.1 hypothetical protein [Amycolatopsis sp. H20-H5]